MRLAYELTTSPQNLAPIALAMSVDSTLSAMMSRRSALRLVVAAGAAVAVVGFTQAIPASAATAGSLTTTTDLNLRAKPRSTAKVLLVMPEGASVEAMGGGANGYRKVRYNGKAGYAFESFLAWPDTGANPIVIGQRLTNTDVNLRSGPSTSSSVIRVLIPGTSVDVSSTVSDGFRNVIHNGTVGWIWDAFLGGPSAGPTKLTTTSAVNHRASASTSAAVLSVIPAGATVGDQEETSSGFRKVSYQGAIGWCWAAYVT